VLTDESRGTQIMSAIGDYLYGLVHGGGGQSSAPAQPSYQQGAEPGAMWFNENAGTTSMNLGTPSGATNWQVIDPNTITGGTGGGTGGGTATPAPADLSQYKAPVLDRIHQIQQAYDVLNGNVDKQVQDQTNQYNQQYDTQAKQLNDAFVTQQGQLGGSMAARGLGQSSFLGDAQGQAANIYNTNNDALTQGRTDMLAGLGRTAQQQHTQNATALQQYQDMINNLGQYDQAEKASAGAGVAGLQNLNNTLGSNLGAVQTQSAGLGTNADFVKSLQQYAPQANQGTAQLAEQLQKITTSGAPKFAKDQIAQGLIKQAQLSDPNAQGYWNNYYQQLLSSGQA